MRSVFVRGSFDDIRSNDIRFLQEASCLGKVTVGLLTDESLIRMNERAPKFSLPERRYTIQAVRYVNEILEVNNPVALTELIQKADSERPIMAVREKDDSPDLYTLSQQANIEYHVIQDGNLIGFPLLDHVENKNSERKKVMVSGCFDWFHSGHVRFFEEVSQFGEVYAVVGHDANLRLLKGEGHPLFPQEERCYMVQAIRYVKQAIISTGHGWMDAEPEVVRIRPDIFIVNEDGDRPEKREFCRKYDIEYIVLKRTPKEGLPRRQSTDLRGF